MQALLFTVLLLGCILSPIEGHKFLIDRDLILQKDGFKFNFHDGEGEVRGTGFQSLGCWKDTWDRAIEPLEGKHELLMDINYRIREDPLRKCAVAALENQLQLFAMENGGECLGDKTAASLYQRFGRAHKCKDDGYGGPSSMQVYSFTGFEVKPLNGGYTKWSQWTKCSKTCGKGTMKRSRACTQPRPANGGMNCKWLGPSVQTKSCQNACSVKETGSLNTPLESLSPITQTFLVPKVSSFTNSPQSTSDPTRRNDDMEDEDEDKNDDDDDDMEKTDKPNINDDASQSSGDMTKPPEEITQSSILTKISDNEQEKNLNREIKAAHDVLQARWQLIARNRLKGSDQQEEHSSSRQKVVNASLTEGEQPMSDGDDEEEELNDEEDDEMQQIGTKRVTEECICPAVMCLHLADTGVLIDNSNVTDMADLAEMKSFAKGLAAGFGTKDKDIQMGIIAAGMRSHVIVPFLETLPLHDFDRRVDGIRREIGPLVLGQAFKRAEAYLLAKQKKAIPPLLNDVLFVMVSGDSDVDVHAPVKDLKSSGAKIVTIGVGKNGKLGKVAAQADKSFMVPPGAGNAMVNAIIAAVCKPDLMGKVIPNPKPCPCMLSPSSKRTSSQNVIAKNSPYSVPSSSESPDSTPGKHQTEISAKPKPQETKVNAEVTTSKDSPVGEVSNSTRKLTEPGNTTGIVLESSTTYPSAPAGTLPATQSPGLSTNPPATFPATSINFLTSPQTNDYPHSEQNEVTGDVIHLTNKKMQPLSKSLSALSDNLNKARAAGELKEGNFTMTNDIKDLLKHIAKLKKLADDLRSDDEQSEKEKSREIRLGGQSVPSTKSNSQSVSSAEFSSQTPFKLQISDPLTPKPLFRNESTLNNGIYRDLKPSLKITNQSQAKPNIKTQSMVGDIGNPSPSSSVSHDTKFKEPNSHFRESSISQSNETSQDTHFLKLNGTSQDVNLSHLSSSQPSSTSKNVTNWPVVSGGFKPSIMLPTATQGSEPVPGDKPSNFFAIESDLAKTTEPPPVNPRSSIPDCDINLGFVLDGSASVEGTKRGNFLKMINFVKDIIHEFTELSRQVHIGTLVYSTKTAVVFTFGSKGTEEMIDRLLDNVHYPGQGSLTGNALKECWNTMFSSAPRGRKSVLLLLTDGPSNDDVAAPSKWIRDAGVELFVIGLGNAYDERQLNIMASGPTKEHVMIKQYDELKSSVQEVRNRLCGFNAHQILQLMTRQRSSDDDVLTAGQKRFQRNQCILDVAFLLDGSRQVETNGEGNFLREINFVKKATKFLPLSRDDVHIGLGLLGDKDVMVFPMNEHYTENAVDYELDHLRYPGSPVIQPRDLKFARDIMLAEGIRDVAPHVFVLVTDVSSLDSYRQAVDDIRKEGNDIIMLGIGSFSWKQEVKVRSAVEGLADQVMSLENTDEVEAVKQFTNNLCKLSYAKRSDIPHQHWKYSQKVLNTNPDQAVPMELLV